MNKEKLSTAEASALTEQLKNRFVENMRRHEGLTWDAVALRLAANPTGLWTLQQMEASGGEPDVVVFDAGQTEVIFCDCAKESPTGRRSLCYDRAAWVSRKNNKPVGDAESMARAMGIEILDEAQYRALQAYGDYDLKSSSWLKTPERIRALGGALFGDKRFDTTFVYHNGVESYYAGRGFRGFVRI